jgi:ABC-type dipeptide/oligopeptide/nickel transport system ATPase component
MKIVGLIGEPAAGKSTVMRKFIDTLEGGSAIVRDGLVVYTLYPDDKVIIAGIYDEQVFSGTDRMSKACGPKVREWLAQMNRDPEWDGYTFYWEGERFSNSKFFHFFYKECPEATVYFLNADPGPLDQRNAARSNQNPTWRKGMATRMRNLRENYPVRVVEQGFSLVGAGLTG